MGGAVTPTELAEVYERILASARACGDVDVERSGSTTELRAPATFATVEIGKRSVDLHLLFPDGRRAPGIVKLISGDSGVGRYTVRLRRVNDVDDEVRAWLCEAYAGARR